MNEALVLWFLNAHYNVPITGPLLAEKAREIAHFWVTTHLVLAVGGCGTLKIASSPFKWQQVKKLKCQNMPRWMEDVITTVP